MAKKRSALKDNIFIYRDSALFSENSDELVERWIENSNNTDKVFIAGEETDVFIVNEANDSLMCMEYHDYE